MNRSLFGILFAAVLFVSSTVFAAADIVAPTIANVKIASTTETSVTLTWQTDEKADSSINYGLQPDYGMIRKPVADRTTHSITLDSLEPGRTYYFRVVAPSVDQATLFHQRAGRTRTLEPQATAPKTEGP